MHTSTMPRALSRAPMRARRSGRRATGLVALALAGALALSGCSGGDPGDGDAAAPTGSPAGSSTSPPESQSTSTAGSEGTSTSAKPYLPVPDGVALTAQGSELSVGDTATVAFEPRQHQVGVLDVTVTRIERTTFKESFSGWQLSDETKRTNPYFVRATVENAGRTDLGGRDVPLYIVDGRNTLIEASDFASTFKPCSGKTLPDRFRHGDREKVCLVYLSPRHGELTAVSFRPTEDFAPITWTGDLKRPKSAEPGKKPAKGKKKG
jgi:hypothetical protein